MVFVVFFFSSRRRHTRFDCDWSSDVCSSDLLPLAIWEFTPQMAKGSRELLSFDDKRGRRFVSAAITPWGGFALMPYVVVSMRSEEHTSELQSQSNLVCRLLLEKKKK